jgi:hypothetical protein
MTRLIAFVVLLLLAAPVLAWNSQGHQIVALIAYDQLQPQTRAKVLDLIRKHPRFEQHFTNDMPDEVWKGSVAEKDGWIFGQAAI